MTGVTIPHSREDSKTVVKAAFEDCPGFKTYHDDGLRIIGKTGASFGLFTSSYGEQVIVEFPVDQPSDTETMVSISGKKEVSMNIGADPEKYVSQLIQAINEIKNKDIDTILEVLEDNNIAEQSKEVGQETEQAGGKGLLYVMLIIILLFTFIFPLMMI